MRLARAIASTFNFTEAAAVAQLRANLASRLGHFLHYASEHAYPIAHQATVSGIVDIRLDHCGIHSHLLTGDDFVFQSDPDHPLVELVDQFR